MLIWVYALVMVANCRVPDVLPRVHQCSIEFAYFPTKRKCLSGRDALVNFQYRRGDEWGRWLAYHARCEHERVGPETPGFGLAGIVPG